MNNFTCTIFLGDPLNSRDLLSAGLLSSGRLYVILCRSITFHINYLSLATSQQFD